jgi:TPR repeat protein
MAWFRKAAEQGHKEAKTKLDELEAIQNANERH